ncbi:hypothetical protein BGZ65_001636, partial [Modicella reniformis]
GYQQAPYGNGYPDQQYDQYDPYYAQHQQQAAQGYYPDQQQGYYPPEEQYPNQFMPPVPLGNNNGYSQGTGSPSMTHATASPKSYPQPPPSTTTGGYPSPSTLLQSDEVPGQSAYDKHAKIENEYVGTQTQTHARNPQLVPEHDDRIKVPL